MNNFPQNNLNLIRSLAMIKANIIAQSALMQGSTLNSQTQNTLLNSLGETFIPAQNQNQIQNQSQQAQSRQNFLSQNAESILDKSILLDKTKLENHEVLKYLQNTMKMPETIEKLVKETVKQQVSESTIEKFLNTILDTKVLNEYLNQSSKAAIDKMLQTIAISVKTGGSDVGQLKEMLSVLTTIHHNTIVDTNTIRELLLLYIPLHCPIFDTQMEFKKVIEGQDGKIKNSTLSILFETINFSNILCCVACEKNDILIELFAIEDFPYKEFERVVQIIAKEAYINIRLDFIRINVTPSDKTKQNFRIVTSEFIPSNTLITAHLLIKTIFRLDDEYQEEAF